MDLHDRFSEAADALAEKAVKSLEEALDSKKKYRVACPKCKAMFAAPFPDFAARAKAIEILRDTGKGKPAQAKAPVEEKAVKAKRLEDLTDEELEALLNDLDPKGSENVEGESGKTDGGAA